MKLGTSIVVDGTELDGKETMDAYIRAEKWFHLV